MGRFHRNAAAGSTAGKRGDSVSFNRAQEAERDHVRRAAAEARRVMAERGDRPRYDLRAATVEDLPLIADAWLQSYRFSPMTQPIPAELYKSEHRERIRRLVTRSKTVCAVDPERHDRIVAWTCFEPPRRPGEATVLHYISVHPSLQGMGIGKTLLSVARSLCPDPEMPVWVTHYTLALKRLVKPWKLLYNPYLLEIHAE